MYHIVDYTTFAGKMFNFYATGDFILAKTPNSDFEVHTRLSKWRSASVNTGVAIKVNGKDVFEYDAKTDGYFFRNQRFAPKFGERRPLPGGATVHFVSRTKFTVSASNRAALLVQIVRGNNFPDGNKGFINLELVTPQDLPISGLCTEQKLIGRGLFRSFQQPAGSTIHKQFKNPEEERRAVQFCNRKFPDAPKMRQGCISDFKQTGNPRMAVAITQSVAKFRQVRKKFQEKHGVAKDSQGTTTPSRFPNRRASFPRRQQKGDAYSHEQ